MLSSQSPLLAGYLASGNTVIPRSQYKDAQDGAIGEWAFIEATVLASGRGVYQACGKAATKSASLSDLMKNSPFRPTQSRNKMDRNKIDEFAELMENGKWNWGKDKIIVDKNGSIMSGHHRVVAAQKAGIKIPESAIHRFDGVTQRPVYTW